MPDSHSAFTGEIPKNYEKYLGPLIFEEYAKDLANRISVAPDTRVLEIAAGTGMATRELRNVIPENVQIVVTDLNEDMLNIARNKFSTDENIEFQTADALELPFEDDSFEAVACQFSVMFFPDKLKALTEAARVLKPGGCFYFNIWDSFTHNHLIKTVNNAIAEYLQADAIKFFSTPYGYYEIDVIKNLLFEAGFGDIDISVLPRTSSAGTARDVALGYVLGTPARLELEQISPESVPKIVDAVEHAIGEEFGYRSLKAKMQAMVFTAHFATDSSANS
jgi:ubiquinone/menaquinone biosynthesis C-methylase UbiE